MNQIYTFDELLEKLSQNPDDIEQETSRYFSTKTVRAQHVEALNSLIEREKSNLSAPKSPINLNLFASLLCELYFEISEFDQSKDPEEIYSSLGSVQCLSFFAQNNVLILEENVTQKRVNLNIEDLIGYVYYEITHACLVGRRMPLAEASFNGHISFFELLNDLMDWMFEDPSDEQAAIRAGCLDELSISYILHCPLDLGYSALTHLPSCIDKFPLENIEVTLPSCLESIPEELVTLKKLTIQHKEGANQADLTFPKHLSRLQNLTTLNLDLQGHTKIPEEVFSLNKLETLTCMTGPLEELSPSIGNLNQLKSLFLSNHKFEVLPKEIGHLFSLKILNLSQNQLKKLPEEIGLLSKLETLILNSNQIEFIPNSFGKLDMLSELQLQENPITTLPKSMAQLKKLSCFIINSEEIDWDVSLSELKEIARNSLLNWCN